jgi:hypothetical protein
LENDMTDTYAIKVVNPRPSIDESLIKGFTDLYDVLSISCVISVIQQKDHRTSGYREITPRRYR